MGNNLLRSNRIINIFLLILFSNTSFSQRNSQITLNDQTVQSIDPGQTDLGSLSTNKNNPTWEITGEDASFISFSESSNSKTISLFLLDPADFETKSIYNFTVTVLNGNQQESIDLVITVNAVDNSPLLSHSLEMLP